MLTEQQRIDAMAALGSTTFPMSEAIKTIFNLAIETESTFAEADTLLTKANLELMEKASDSQKANFAEVVRAGVDLQTALSNLDKIPADEPIRKVFIQLVKEGAEVGTAYTQSATLSSEPKEVKELAYLLLILGRSAAQALSQAQALAAE